MSAPYPNGWHLVPLISTLRHLRISLSSASVAEIMAKERGSKHQSQGDRPAIGANIPTSPNLAHPLASPASHISSAPLPSLTGRASSEHLRSSPRLEPRAALSSDMPLGVRHRKALSESGPAVTYTPTTHRVSKAKKGKRVHVCEFPGCGKVFTRAEHRRRHELNHNPEASFPCSKEGCQKAFHRPDLLARHMERHDLDSRTTSPRPPRPTQSNHIPTTPEVANLVSPTPLHRPLPASTQQSSPISIDSLVQPGATPHFGNDFSMPMWVGVERLLGHGDIFPSLAHAPTDEAVLYSSPASSRSPSSEENPFQLPHQPSVMEQFPQPYFNPQLTGSPIPLETAFSDWNRLETAAHPSPMIPVSLEGDILQSPFQYQYPSPTWTEMNGLPCEGNLLPPPESFRGLMAWR